MTESTFTFRVDDDLKTAFARLAKARDRNAAQLLRDFMRAEVQGEHDRDAHDAWFRASVGQAMREADEADVRLHDHDDVMYEARSRLRARIDSKDR
ncbi:CopG family ribbon-helix-helix protein [Marinivivus vitaminiproducens]|uniref:CopG family ribbon-helix-helix protein n=1 Tax=Marinivivus vitaminiproducens TaxID=3035935 RepID=UPI002797F0FB|nr:hypothetical protein P4R82_18335 [Geminicoccaceae bacterium SCSIO 64248]